MDVLCLSPTLILRLQVFATHILSLKDRIHPSNNQLHIKQRKQHKVQSKIKIKVKHDHHRKFLKRNFEDFEKLMNHISPIASLMCRRKCMLIELKELTAWLNVKKLQQQQQRQPPRWLQHAFYNHNQLKRKQLHRIIELNTIEQSSSIDCHKSIEKCVERDIAATWSISSILYFQNCFDIAHLIQFITIYDSINMRFQNFISYGFRFFSLTNCIRSHAVMAISLVFSSVLINLLRYTHIFLINYFHIACDFIDFLYLIIFDYTSKEKETGHTVDKKLMIERRKWHFLGLRVIKRSSNSIGAYE